jgi:hypothetical protein
VTAPADAPVHGEATVELKLALKFAMMLKRTLIIKRALMLIGPESARWTDCATAVNERIRLLCLVWEELRTLPTPGVLREELKEIVRDLNRTKRAFAKYSRVARAVIFEDDMERIAKTVNRRRTVLIHSARQQAFFDTIEHWVEKAKFHHDSLKIPPGGHQWDNVKAIAAKYAKELLLSFSPKPPTLSYGGAFYKLAAHLYKAATGEDAELEQYCRQVDLGRIEPSVVVRRDFSPAKH